MTRKRNLWISFVAALFATMLVYAVYELQLRQIKEEVNVEIVVPLQFIDAGKMIEGGMIGTRTIGASGFIEGMLADQQLVVGQKAMVPLGKGEPILAWKLDELELLPHADQSTFQIPRSYILSISSGIRAGDRVIIYGSGVEVDSKRLLVEEVTVASVKSSSFTEVDNAEHSALLAKVRDNQEQLYASRRDASAPIDHINLNLTEEQWLILDEWCQVEKGKLVIAYVGMSKPYEVP